MVLLPFVLCVYDIAYQIVNTMMICSLKVVLVWISLPLDEKNNVERFLCNLYKLEWKFGAAQDILVLIAHGKCILNQPYWCSGESVLKFGLCLHLHLLNVYTGIFTGYTFSQDRLLLHCSTLSCEPKSNVLAHFIYYFFTIYNQCSLLWNVHRMNWM